MEAVPGCPVADLVVILDAHDEPRGRYPERIDGASVVAAAERRIRAVVKEPAPEDLRHRVERFEVGVVSGSLAGDRDVDGVMKVVAPLPVQAVAAGFTTRDEPRIVQIRFGDQRQRPPGPSLQHADFGGQFFEDVRGAGVAQGVDGVEP